MSSGIGRGRGWLHLSKNLQNPGGVPSTLESKTLSFNTKQIQDYTNLLNLIEELDLKDDGILFNHKLKAILQAWKAETQTGAQVEESLKYIYLQCRKNRSLASKVVAMVWSFTRTNVKIHEVMIRKLFITLAQNDFNNRSHLQNHLPDEFRNAVYMLAEYLSKLDSAKRVFIIPVLQYFQMLLDSAKLSDIELFTLQFYLNGAYIKEVQEDTMTELLMCIRGMLAKNVNLCPQSRIWLLLAIDVAHLGFAILPPAVLKFYQDELGEATMAKFQGRYSIIRIEPPTIENANTNQESTESVNIVNSCEKMGRPILGVGARPHKLEANRNSSESQGYRNVDKNLTPNKTEQIKDYKHVKKHNKGWLHDDREDVDYE